MVVLTETVCCPACSSSEVVRFGKTGAGDQRYRCHSCRRVFGLHPNRRSHPDSLKQQVLDAYQERASMRGVCRVFGISRNTLIKWLGEKAQTLPPLEKTLLAPQKGDSLEADEMWSFVVSKKNQIWTWLCVSYLTGQVIAYAVGDRSADTGRVLFNRVPKVWRKKLVYTDLYSVYRAIVPKWKHRPSEKGSGRTNTVELSQNVFCEEQQHPSAVGAVRATDIELQQVPQDAREKFALVSTQPQPGNRVHSKQAYQLTIYQCRLGCHLQASTPLAAGY